MSTRKGALRLADIPPEIRWQLNTGKLETATLVEMLAIDFAMLMQHTVPEISDAARMRLHTPDDSKKTGITKRMAMAGEILWEQLGMAGFSPLACHPCDTVRSWAAYLLANNPELTLPEKLHQIRPLADDAHSGVREWAWLALRAEIVTDIQAAVAALRSWVTEDSPNLRRFAVEITRPRGVWCVHLPDLKQNPALGLPLLAPLKADPSHYVQNSVANWLNDAAKSQPQWVRQLCQQWQAESSRATTHRICKRALRSLK